MKKNKKELAYALSSITQLGISIVISFLIWIFLAIWLKNTFKLGNYVVVTGIILGIGSAGTSFYSFYKKASSITSEKEKKDGKI